MHRNLGSFHAMIVTSSRALKYMKKVAF